MSEKSEDPWKDCNCMNCRLARIEDNLKTIKHLMDNLPHDFEESTTESPA
jgi:hypothetical protein